MIKTQQSLSFSPPASFSQKMHEVPSGEEASLHLKETFSLQTLDSSSRILSAPWKQIVCLKTGGRRLCVRLVSVMFVVEPV